MFVKKIMNWTGRACLLACGVCSAELSFAPIFNDGAVLQCEMPVNIWGTADPGASVAVEFAGQKKQAMTDSDGNWTTRLGAMPASSDPRNLMVVSSIGNQKAVIDNVVIGEVWLAAGQSNMEMALRNSDGGDERLKMTLPDIRFVKVPRKTGLPVEKEYTASELAWKTFEPGSNNELAAVAFYFAEALQPAVGRQIGIIQSSYGGTPCEAWTPMWALDENPELKYLSDETRKGLVSVKTKEQWEAEVAAFHKFWMANHEWSKTRKGPAPKAVPQTGKDNPWSSKTPTVLYENMVVPLVPYTARGVVWYQGESNSGNPDEYRILFPAMIKAWRKVWNRPEWPFLFVQLAAYDHPSTDWPGLRAAQAYTRDTVPHTGMALAIDVGEEKEIHPRAKQPLGERLARLARAQVYGEKIVSCGPVFQSLESNNGTMHVVFQHSEKGLKTSDGQSEVPGFELAGLDEKFHPAQAKIISKDTVELTCSAVGKPISVRYAWANWPEPPVTLQNSAGLPAEPLWKTINRKEIYKTSDFSAPANGSHE